MPKAAAQKRHAYKSDNSWLPRCKVCKKNLTHDLHFTEPTPDHPVGQYIRPSRKR
jgi:hypothetical protein